MRAILKYVQVDAFTRSPFKGNPAAVFVLKEALADDLMQGIAAELNLSESAFLVKDGDDYRLRWFTSTTEVNLCGHATLASAHVLWTEGYAGHGETLRFHTRSGVLEAKKRADHICMNFPAVSLESFQEAPREVGELPGAVFAGCYGGSLCVEMASEAQVQNYQPDFERIVSWPGDKFILTARSQQPLRDFVSRVFVPKHGIPEDPVTGSAHCLLGPYWMQKLGKSQVVGEQLSRRTGVVHMEKIDDPARLIISGQAVTMLKGIFLL